MIRMKRMIGVFLILVFCSNTVEAKLSSLFKKRIRNSTSRTTVSKPKVAKSLCMPCLNGDSVENPAEAQLKDILGFSNPTSTTCFQNSVLKLLSVHPKFQDLTNALLNPLDANPLLQNDLNTRHKVQNSLFQIYSKLEFYKYVTFTQPDFTIENPSFDSELDGLINHFEDYLQVRNLGQGNYFDRDEFKKYYFRKDQMDAAEYLTTLLSILNYSKYFGTFKEASHIHFDSGVQRLCEQSEKNESTLLSLEISSPQIRSIKDALNHFMASERMVGDDAIIEDTVTRKKEPSTKKIVLTQGPLGAPAQIMIQLKRFSTELAQVEVPFHFPNEPQIHYEKIQKTIEISNPIQLDFYNPSLINGIAQIESSKTYHPIAVIVHIGSSIRMGHYYAYIYEKETDSWFIHNDERVRKLEALEMEEAWKNMNKNGYLVLYSE